MKIAYFVSFVTGVRTGWWTASLDWDSLNFNQYLVKFVNAFIVAATATKKLQTFTPVPELGPTRVWAGAVEVAGHPLYPAPYLQHPVSYRAHHCYLQQPTTAPPFSTFPSHSAPPSSWHAIASASAATGALSARQPATAAWWAFVPALAAAVAVSLMPFFVGTVWTAAPATIWITTASTTATASKPAGTTGAAPRLRLPFAPLPPCPPWLPPACRRRSWRHRKCSRQPLRAKTAPSCSFNPFYR